VADIKTLQRLKERVDDLRQEVNRSTGARDEAMRTLKKEFGCENISEAKKLLKKKKEDEEQKREAFDKAMKTFEDEWSEELES